MREAVRARHFSSSTEKAYADWTKRFVILHGISHPEKMREREINQFLSYLAVKRNEIILRNAKGKADRPTLLPMKVKRTLAVHITHVRRQHDEDLRKGAGYVALPYALGVKYPRAAREWDWQWVFPVTRFYIDRVTGERRRHHLHVPVQLESDAKTVNIPWMLPS